MIFGAAVDGWDCGMLTMIGAWTNMLWAHITLGALIDRIHNEHHLGEKNTGDLKNENAQFITFTRLFGHAFRGFGVFGK